MPPVPETGFLNAYIFEDPALLGGVLIFLGAVIGFLGMRDGIRRRLIIGLVFAALGGLVFAAGAAVKTSGEHAEEVTRSFVDNAVASNIAVAMSNISEDAVLNMGQVNNPGLPVGIIRSQLGRLAAIGVESNTITQLDGYTLADDKAEVRLSCVTSALGYPTPSKWVLNVSLEDDNTWRIDRLTLISVRGREPSFRFH